MSHIRVRLERSGGFGGLLPPPRTLDSADLTPEAGEELAELVEAAARAQPASAEPERRVPDAMQYELAILREGRALHLSFDDATMPPEVRPLIARIEKEGRPE
jgi:hypothetical protein